MYIGFPARVSARERCFCPGVFKATGQCCPHIFFCSIYKTSEQAVYRNSAVLCTHNGKVGRRFHQAGHRCTHSPYSVGSGIYGTYRFKYDTGRHHGLWSIARGKGYLQARIYTAQFSLYDSCYAIYFFFYRIVLIFGKTDHRLGLSGNGVPQVTAFYRCYTHRILLNKRQQDPHHNLVGVASAQVDVHPGMASFQAGQVNMPGLHSAGKRLGCVLHFKRAVLTSGTTHIQFAFILGIHI